MDLPSLDREEDQGLVQVHSIFFGMPERDSRFALSDSEANESRKNATATELCFIPQSVEDGFYLLNLQYAPLLLDAVPCRPLISPLKNL